MSEKAKWLEQAQFMRDVGAIHAEWSATSDGYAVDTKLELTKLTLGPPQPVARAPLPATPATTMPNAARVGAGNGPAASLARMHHTMFAASTMKPRLPEPAPSSDVPRAVSAKKAAARGSKKASKRNAR